MSKSAILKSSIAKKWWMALTGLFLCLFLVGHLLGNLQLLIPGDEGQRAFNEYAYFMTHNPFIKVLSYLTYFSILFHAVDGFLLTFQNKKARPVKYAYSKPERNSALPSRYMAILGTAILVFIIMHMANFWAKMHFQDDIPLEKMTYTFNSPSGESRDFNFYTTHNNGVTLNNLEEHIPVGSVLTDSTKATATHEIRNKTEFYLKDQNIKVAEGYKDLHSITTAFFGHDKTEKAGIPANNLAVLAVILYVLAMAVLAFHLWHGFASAFQTLGLNNEKYTPLLTGFGKVFSVLIPLGFAVIPVVIFLTK
ncbi:MAG: succinate dehydrogenase cytochrome b subunit [Fluviicola sp.]